MCARVYNNDITLWALHRLVCDSQTKCEQWHERIVLAVKPPATLSKLFAFRHSALCKDHGVHHDPGNIV